MTKKIEWIIREFDQLSVYQLYDMLSLRSEVFVVEQNAAYLDPDNKDQKALHLLGYLDSQLIAYSRLFRAGDYFGESSIGRVLVAPAYRKSGYGVQLLDIAISSLFSRFGKQVITISAQLYLQHFYESRGFRVISEVYQEDGIPHVRMELCPS